MDAAHSFLPLLIVLAIALVVPILLSRLKRVSIPIVVGEILAGMIVGRSGIAVVPPNDPFLVLLADFGIVFLMFLSGMEIDFQSLRSYTPASERRGSSRLGVLPLALLNFALTLALAGFAASVLVRFGLATNIWIVALILSTTSLGVVVPVLKEVDLITQRLGQCILVSAVIADFVTMLLITVAVAIVSHGLTSEILLIVLLFVAFFLTHRFGTIFNKVVALRRTVEELSHATAQIKVRAAFTIMIAFVALAETLGSEVILGAFLAGAIIGLLRTADDAELSHQLEAIGYGFFIPIFFVKVGVEFNLPILLTSPGALLLVPFLLLGAILVKMVPALTFTMNFSLREALAAGILLSARLSLIIAAAAIGKRLGVIGESVNAAIILVAVVTVTVAPLIFVRMVPGSRRSKLRRTIVVGAEDLGLQVARQLKAHLEPVLIVDTGGGTNRPRNAQRFRCCVLYRRTRGPANENRLRIGARLGVHLRRFGTHVSRVRPGKERLQGSPCRSAGDRSERPEPFRRPRRYHHECRSRPAGFARFAYAHAGALQPAFAHRR